MQSPWVAKIPDRVPYRCRVGGTDRHLRMVRDEVDRGRLVTVSEAQHHNHTGDGPTFRPNANGDLKLSASALNSRGARLYLRFLCPTLAILGIVLVPSAIAFLATVGTVDGPHTSTRAMIYWVVTYIWVLLTGILLIYVGTQMPRYGVVVTSESLTFRGLRRKRVILADIAAIDIGEAQLIRQPVIAPILVMRDGQKVPVIALSIRQAPLSSRLPIEHLRPMVDELRSRIGVEGVQEKMPHFKVRATGMSQNPPTKGIAMSEPLKES
jgi:hypothetical protein